MSILEGELAEEIAEAFSDDALTGAVWRQTSGGLDEHGDPLPGVWTSYPFKGWREAYDAMWASQAGIPTADVRILAFLATISIQPVQGDHVAIGGRWHSVRAIEGVDAAGAAMLLQAYETSDPR